MRVEEKAARTVKAATAGRYINSLQPTGWSLLLRENLSHDADASRRLNSGVMPLRIKTEAELNESEKEIYCDG